MRPQGRNRTVCRLSIYIYNIYIEHAPLPKGGWCLDPTCFVFCKWYHPAVSQWKSRKCSYGWLPIHPIMNQNKLLSGPVSALLPSSADFYSFSLSGRFRAIGLTLYIYIYIYIYIINIPLTSEGLPHETGL